MTRTRYSIELDGVPETLLWPLYCRADESSRPDSLFRDEMAVRVRESIVYDFSKRFGDPQPVLALRAACFDTEVRAFLAQHPRGTIVALGDGLETQFWRADNGEATWLSIDLPEVIALRRRILPANARSTSIASSALEQSWMDSVDPSEGLFITAQGLFMYLTGDDVMSLIHACAERFPGAHLLFDAVPKWLTAGSGDDTLVSRIMMRGRAEEGKYSLPPMHWGAGVDKIRRTIESSEFVSRTAIRTFPPGRGFTLGTVYPTAVRLPVVRNFCPSVVRVDFSE